MGYWAASPHGTSLQLVGGRNPDGSEMLWGDAPADYIDDGIHKLIDRLKGDLGRFPSVAELDAARPDAPEMLKAVAKAKKVFARDIEREATDGEIAAGLAFSDSEIALDSEIRADINVGDTISFALWRDTGFCREIDKVVAGEMISEFFVTKTGFLGGEYEELHYLVRLPDGSEHKIPKAYASKVLPGDRSVDERNAERESR